eukprot:1408653-Rhodomonas_salina.1
MFAIWCLEADNDQVLRHAGPLSAGIVAMEAVKGAEVTEDDTFKAPDPDDEDGEEGGGSKFKFQDPGLAAGGIGMG